MRNETGAGSQLPGIPLAPVAERIGEALGIVDPNAPPAPPQPPAPSSVQGIINSRDAAYQQQRSIEEQVAAGQQLTADELSSTAPQPPSAPTQAAPRVFVHPNGMAEVGNLSEEQVTAARGTLDAIGHGLQEGQQGPGRLLLDQNQMTALVDAGILPASLHQEARVQASRYPEAPDATGGATTRTELSTTMHAPVPQDILAEQQSVQEKLDQLRREALDGQIDSNAALAEGVGSLAALRESQQSHMESLEAGRAQEYQNRLNSIDHTLLAIRQNRVDPEAFFGQGAGTRMGAAIVVALGELARSIGGDTVNRAAQIIENRIQQSIAAQQMNQQNLQRSAMIQNQAMAQYRAILGDERAAEAAARAAGWEAAIGRVQATVRNAASPVIRANGNSLILAARMRQLQDLATVYQNAWSITAKQTTRGGPTAMQGAAQIMGAQAAQQQQAQMQASQGTMAAANEQANQQFGQPDMVISQQAARAAEVQQTQRRRRQQVETRYVGEPPTPQGQFTQLPETTITGRAPTAPAAPQTPPRPRVALHPFTPGATPGEGVIRAEGALSDLQRQGGGAPRIHPGLAIIPGQEAFVAQNYADPQIHHSIDQDAVMANTVFRQMQDIMRLRAQVGGETFRTAEGQQMVTDAINLMNGMRQGTGMGAYDEGTRQLLSSVFPDPTQRRIEGIAGFDSIYMQYLGAYRSLMQQVQGRLQARGLEIDNEARRVRLLQSMYTQARAAHP